MVVCSMLGHEKLHAWRLCHELALAVYRSTEQWPRSERYGLVAQIRRAAASAPTNIAEGSGKRGTKECRRFIDIALGSLAETSYLLTLAKDLGLTNVTEWQKLDELRRRAGGLTWRLARSLDSRKG
jgi:four helix bundle protein